MSHEEEIEGTSQKGLFNIGSVGGDASGNFVGKGNIIIKGSTLTHGNADDQAELDDLLKQLEAALEKVPVEQQEEAETVAEYAEELVGEASKEKPKETKLKITGKSLKEAAQNLVEIAPLIGVIAGKIVLKVLALGG